MMKLLFACLVFLDVASFTSAQAGVSWYNCDFYNPCGNSSTMFYYPSYDPQFFIQCGLTPEQCYYMSCRNGTVWNQASLTCVDVVLTSVSPPASSRTSSRMLQTFQSLSTVKALAQTTQKMQQQTGFNSQKTFMANTSSVSPPASARTSSRMPQIFQSLSTVKALAQTTQKMQQQTGFNSQKTFVANTSSVSQPGSARTSSLMPQIFQSLSTVKASTQTTPKMPQQASVTSQKIFVASTSSVSPPASARTSSRMLQTFQSLSTAKVTTQISQKMPQQTGFTSQKIFVASTSSASPSASARTSSRMLQTFQSLSTAKVTTQTSQKTQQKEGVTSQKIKIKKDDK